MADSTPTQLSRPPRHGPQSPPPVWGQIPARNTGFVGREELLTQLHEHLVQGATAVVPHSLHGMGGVGKTQVALEYVYRHRHDYELVWWIPADSPAQIQQSLSELANRLRLPTAGEAAVAVRGVLEALRIGEPSRNWLLIYDNAGSPEALRPYLPVDGPGQILVTSRQAEWRRNRTAAVEVSVFTRAESRQLLQQRGPTSLTEEAADRIADKLGDLPLAVEQTAVWLTETMMAPEEWLRLFDEKSAELLKEAGTDHHSSVAATMNLSLNQLADTNPAALQLLRVCAFLASQPVPRRLFYGARNVEVPDELAGLLTDPIKLGRALRAVDRYALVKIDHRNESFQLHQLVQLTLMEPLATAEQDRLRHCAHMLLANLNPGDPASSPDWPRYLELLPHVWASELVNCDNDWARQLVLGEMEFLSFWGGYEEGRELGELTLTRWREHLGPEHTNTVRAELIHASTLRQLGRFQEAHDLCTRAVNTLTETHGPDDMETLDARRLVCWDLRNLGDFHGAVEVSAEVLAKHERLFGREDLATLRSAHAHAVGLRLNGAFEESIEIFWYNFQRLQEIVGPEHQNTNGSRHGHAVALMESGRYPEAESELDQLATELNQIRDADAPGRLSVLASQSVAKRRTGQLQYAQDLCAEAWHLSMNRNGPATPATMLIANAYAVALRTTGELDQALELAEDTQRRHRELFGRHHPYFAGALMNYAAVLTKLGRTDEALRLNENALAVLVEQLGADHPNSIATSVNLLTTIARSDNLARAIELGEQTVRRCDTVLQPRHPLTLAARRNLTLERHQAGEPDSADELAAIEQDYVEVFGPQHPATLAARKHIRATCDIFLTAM